MIIIFSINVGAVILSEASLSFLGYGLPLEVPSWGGMLSREGRKYMDDAPWLALWPGLCLTIVVYSLNMFGDAVRDLPDPRLSGGVGGVGGLGARGMKLAKRAIRTRAAKAKSKLDPRPVQDDYGRDVRLRHPPADHLLPPTVPEALMVEPTETESPAHGFLLVVTLSHLRTASRRRSTPAPSRGTPEPGR